MALDERGRFASSQVLGEIDGGTLQRVTPPGSRPALIIASDYPIAAAQDGGLYYVPFQQAGPRELIRRTPDGQRAVIATLPADTSPTSQHRIRYLPAVHLGPIPSTSCRPGRTAIENRDAAGPADLGRQPPPIPKGPRRHARAHFGPGRRSVRPHSHGEGHTLLRAALVLADHNLYHLGQFVFPRRLLRAWQG
jgi:hypothetical protein